MNDPQLKVAARDAIAATDAEVFVSAASAWEIAIKRALGKLQAPLELAAMLERHRFHALPITLAHAEAAGALPRHHNDPFDRALVAQAKIEELVTVTRDPRFALYGIGTLPA